MFDALVVGAGPAGSTAAYHMARAGLSVLLVDRVAFPRDKVCGDAISRKATRLLAEMEIDLPLHFTVATPSYGVRLCGGHGEALALSFHEDFERGTPPGYVCSRRTFDALLLARAIEAGCTFWHHARFDELLWARDRVVGARIAVLEAPYEGASGAFPRSETVKAPLVLGADGAYSVVARELRMPQPDEKHFYSGARAYFEGVAFDDPLHHLEVHFLDHLLPGYFWIFPLPDGRANVGVAMLAEAVKERGVEMRAILEECLQYPQLSERFAGSQMVGAPKAWGLPLGSRPRKLFGNGWMLLGDAASLVDPFAGEGIGNAMISGRHAAECAARAVEQRSFGTNVLRGYGRSVMRELSSEFRLSRSLQRLGHRKWLLNSVIRRGSRSRELAAIMTGMFDDAGKRRRLLSPLFYLRLMVS